MIAKDVIKLDNIQGSVDHIPEIQSSRVLLHVTNNDELMLRMLCISLLSSITVDRNYLYEISLTHDVFVDQLDIFYSFNHLLKCSVC
jgi:hypothetical protein